MNNEQISKEVTNICRKHHGFRNIEYKDGHPRITGKESILCTDIKIESTKVSLELATLCRSMVTLENVSVHIIACKIKMDNEYPEIHIQFLPFSALKSSMVTLECMSIFDGKKKKYHSNRY